MERRPTRILKSLLQRETLKVPHVEDEQYHEQVHTAIMRSRRVESPDTTKLGTMLAAFLTRSRDVQERELRAHLNWAEAKFKREDRKFAPSDFIQYDKHGRMKVGRPGFVLAYYGPLTMIPGLENILEKGQNSNDSRASMRLSYATKCYQEALVRQEAQPLVREIASRQLESRPQNDSAKVPCTVKEAYLAMIAASGDGHVTLLDGSVLYFHDVIRNAAIKGNVGNEKKLRDNWEGG